MADRIPSHITLAPPLVIALANLDEVVTRLSEVARDAEPFTVSLLGTGSFRPISPVVFVAVSEGIAEIELLAQSVWKALETPAAVFPFHPHVTVAHNVDEETLERAADELRDFHCQFDVTEVHLYIDDPDRGWLPTHAFSLG